MRRCILRRIANRLRFVLLRGGAVVARLPHKQKVGGAIPPPATKQTAYPCLDSFKGKRHPLGVQTVVRTHLRTLMPV